MKDIVVFTAITRGYDSLKELPASWWNGAYCVAFLEEPQDAPGWQIRPIYRRFRDPCRNAKIHKILPHKYFPEAKYSLWIDGSVLVKDTSPPQCWIQKYLGECDLALFKHRTRNCIYQEANECRTRGLDFQRLIDRQIRRYRANGYPANNGLAECTVLLRRHTTAMNLFNEAWYREICAHSRRDQLSFNYVAHRLDFKFAYLPGTMARNPHVLWLSHSPESRR